MCNSKIINKKKTNSHKTLAIENQPNKQTNKQTNYNCKRGGGGVLQNSVGVRSLRERQQTREKKKKPKVYYVHTQLLLGIKNTYRSTFLRSALLCQINNII